MEWVETTGKSVEEAKDAALDQLGVDESDAEFVVMSEPRAGLFGRMRGEARVRARVMPTSPRPKRTRSRRQGQETRSPRKTRGEASKQGGRSQGGVSVADRGGADDFDEADDAPGSNGEGTASSNGTGRTGSSQSPRRRRSRGGAQARVSGGAPAQASDNGPATERDGRGTAGGARRERGPARSRGRAGEFDATKEEAVGEDLSLEEQGESARQFIEGLVGLLGLQGSVTTGVLDEDTVQVAVDGPELGILIGPGGGTLGALQELARTVVQRQTGGRSERILIDVAGYRAKRAAALQRFTQQVVEEVLSSASERALEPMSASDRKVVHDTVNEIEGVETRSVGEEPRRYIVVAPSASSTGTSETEDA